MAMEFKVKTPGGRLRSGQCEWLLGHATLAIIKHRFARARALALGMARAGMVELDGGLIGRSNLTMSGELLGSGDLQFATDAEAAGNPLAPRVARHKNERRRATAEAASQRQAELGRLCTGPCLRFTWRGGWSAVSATVPDVAGGAVIRRNRLFVEGHPPFLLFATSSGYCARMVDVALEVLDEQPWAAIDTLRIAYTRHRRLQTAESSPEVTNDPLAAERPHASRDGVASRSMTRPCCIS